MEKNLLIAILVILSVFFAATIIVFLSSKRSISSFSSLKNRILKKQQSNLLETKNFASQLGGVLIKLSQNVVGGLIVVARNDSLNDYVKLGYSVFAKFSSEFVVNIFYNKQSPLHDGGIIVKDGNIISVSSYFPMTKTNLVTSYGARHRAAFGVSEETDAIAFVVSETTGVISYAHKSVINNLNNKDIKVLSNQIYQLLTKNKIENLNSEEIMINNSL